MHFSADFKEITFNAYNGNHRENTTAIVFGMGTSREIKNTLVTTSLFFYSRVPVIPKTIAVSPLVPSLVKERKT